MENNIQEEVNRIMKKSGNVRGDILRDHFLYIKEKEGDSGVQKMESLLEECGYSLKFSEIKEMDWYKDAFCGLFLYLLNKFFGWNEDEFFRMGERVTKYSFIATRILLRYFISMDVLLREAPKIWKKHVDFGNLEVVDYDKEKKHVFIKITDYDIHPFTCSYQRGYYKGLFGYVLKEKNITVEEEKCIYHGDPFHLYKISWK